MGSTRNDGTIKVALTYDDGPTEHTLDLLDVLEKAGVKATFFVRGDRAQSRPEVLSRLGSSPLIEIAGHSMTHPDLRVVNDSEVSVEVIDSQMVIEVITGRRVVHFRPPQGHYDERVRRAAMACGQALILWTLTSLDWKHRSSSMTAKIVTESIRDGDIVLLHDSEPSTVDGTRQFLYRLLGRRVEFVTVSELLGPTQPGHIYRGNVSLRTRALRRILGRLGRHAEKRQSARRSRQAVAADGWEES